MSNSYFKDHFRRQCTRNACFLDQPLNDHTRGQVCSQRAELLCYLPAQRPRNAGIIALVSSLNHELIWQRVLWIAHGHAEMGSEVRVHHCPVLTKIRQADVAGNSDNIASNTTACIPTTPNESAGYLLDLLWITPSRRFRFNPPSSSCLSDNPFIESCCTSM
jgi:hypothetical protein